MNAVKLDVQGRAGSRRAAALAGAIAALLLGVGPAGAADAPLNNWENPDGQLGSLARANLTKDHPAHPVDLTGTYVPEGFWEFQPYPKLKPAAQKQYDEVRAGAAKGLTINDVTGQCWPPGMPILMTRVWPFHVIPMKTAIAMIFNFESQVRWIFMDGRQHTDPDYVVPTYNGESIGRWEGDTLVVDTRNIEPHMHFIDRLVPLSDQFHIIERMRSIDNGDRLQIEYTMTDQENWEGDWVVTKTFKRQERVDFEETHCLPNTNEGLPAMQERYTRDLEE